ncbi:little elongation complex subunit 2 [Solea senegalensis]|uniref:Little elongation complex subunit 2 n=1 Tax=Solea senegalensis TaxID=28829 RepID=A0AAV6T0M6_SOLSE|nr:little elongation complex subunit 2 [Solea senegalensis]KAG7522926.1 little elongation complex subunit 2 [Solea senegalensis]
MELEWEDPPVPDAPFFTRDVYDKFSLAPTTAELWSFLQSPVENANIKQGGGFNAAKDEDDAQLQDNSCVSICLDSCDSDEPEDTAKEASKGTKKSNVKPKATFPEPRLPYPCPSTLSIKEQNMYLGFLTSKTAKDPPQTLKTQVNNEVMQFMRYLQDVARMCVDDYNFISPGAMQYSEDFFRACLECIKTIPQLYQIHEMTSLTGGTFNPGLMLNFEKQLLIMGNVDFTQHQILPADAQLASDYQAVSSENPPAKKAKDMHATVSSDGNAEKLSAHYEPHVCMTRDALVKLLDNCGPDFREPWELPVWIKLNPSKGSSQKKTVYIDSPLLKTEMTVRERSHFYHEESLKLSIKKKGCKNVFHLMTELPSNELQLSPDSSRRNLTSFENDGLDFEVDFTDLETFGETTSNKAPKAQNGQQACVQNKKAASVPPSKNKTSSEDLANTSSDLPGEMNSSLMDMDDPMTKVTPQSYSSVPKTERLRQDSSNTDMGSDDEKLVIDDSLSPAATPTQQPPCSSVPPVSEAVPVNANSSSPQKVTRQSKKSKAGDQLGEILRMQTKMFNSANSTSKSSSLSQETSSPTRCLGPSVYSHPTSLIKPCVTSYLERNQDQDGETCTPSHKFAPVVNNTIEHKKILSQDLQDGAEDEQDYEAPEGGNLLYKLYSLQDLLVMVRTSVSLSHTRKVGSQNQIVPVHVLPKLEYQLSYGVECLTSSEACQLWTENLLHSSTVSYIAHINALSSKVVMVRSLRADWKQNISCGFKPSNSLNILHHLLKKLTRLDEGRYLVTHKAGEPFVTLLKAATGKVNRGAYDLQQVHSSVPQPPAAGFVPWVPLDPAMFLPFHKAHGRVPCTFPPKAERDESFQANNRGAGQSTYQKNAGGKKKKKKKQTKRTAKRNNYIKKLVRQSV